jgi:tetratricopeptide (TPR) repeat protein
VITLDGAAPSLQDILRLRQQDTFVGRDSRIAEFRHNLRLPATDPGRRFIVNIHGIAGVGKSFLLQQFRRIAQAEGAACALVNEDYFDIVETMSALAADLSGQGARLTEFEAQLATYRQRRRELESDPNAPLGDMITTTTLRAGVALAKSVPVAGAVAEFVDPDAVAAQANRFRAYLVQRFGKKSDIDLLLAPIEVLTRSFVGSVDRLAAERPVVLFFDTFERTAPYLESWLLDLFTGKFGGLSAEVVTAIAGQLALADNRWSPLRSLIASHPLEPFTEAEARDFLTQRGVTDEAVVKVILPLSGSVPMWLATLAESNPRDPGAIPDPSEDAVERFLKWEPDDHRRDLAKAAALPRRFNRDVLRAMPDASDADELFDWLRRLPFVSRTTDHWRYHDAVRDPMLRLARITSPQRWRDQHLALAAHFAAEQAALGLADGLRWSDPDWQALALEETYHRLCAAPGAALPHALEKAVEAAEASVALARRWSAMLSEAGSAAGAERLRSWGGRLTDLLKDQDDDSAFLTALIDSGELGSEHLANALAVRGDSHRSRKRYEQSIADLDRALELRPEQPRFHRWRGLTFQAMRRYDDAVADLTRSIDLDQSSAQAFAQRGVTYRLMGRDEEAFADLGRAIGLDPENDWYYAQRGITYQIAGRYEESLADLGRAIALDPAEAANFRLRGVTFQLAERYEESLADLDRAIELDPADEGGFAERGYTRHLMGRHDEAFADFGRAIAIDGDQSWTYALRGSAYRSLSRYEEALADLDRAIELNPDNEWVIAERAATCRALDRHEQAIADFDRAIELDPDYQWALSQRGAVLRDTDRQEAALADFDRAIELNPADGWTIMQRAKTLQVLGRHREALADLDRAIELDPANDWRITQRALAYRSLGCYEEALTDFGRALELAPDPYWDLMERGATLRVMGRHEEALADLDRAIGSAPDRDAALCQQGLTYIAMERHDLGLRDFERAVRIDPDDAWTHLLRGRALRGLGRYEEARTAFGNAVRLLPDYEPALAYRGEVNRQLGDLEPALADLDRAVALAPDDVWNLSQRSAVHHLMGNAEAAIADLDRALALDPSNDWSRFLKAIVLKSARREAEGMTDLLAAVDLALMESDPESVQDRFSLVVYLLVLGRTEEAATALDAVLLSGPTAAAALDFIEDLSFLAVCPGLEVDGLEAFSRIATEYRDARLGEQRE